MQNYEYKPESVWHALDDTATAACFQYGDDYKSFLDEGKTERECAALITMQAQQAGFVPLEYFLRDGVRPEPGSRLYLNHKNKAVVLMVVGQKPLQEGMHIVGSHIDAPRLDLKARPLYEANELALCKTHYYGGIKKYQWTCVPLALHGIAYTTNGQTVYVRIGDDANDPVLYITDLLPHLAKDQQEKPLKEAITAEQLNAVIGHIPLQKEDGDDDIKNPVKANILRILHDKYGLVEEDLLLAELELVPAQSARDVGLDRALIAAHGHDDRSCTYAALAAMMETAAPEYTAVALFVDKEEIGSVGNTGMQARFFENAVAELLALESADSELAVRRTFANSRVLSADVTAAIDPTFPEVMDEKNSAVLGKGVTISKFTGARGKSGSNDANAEFLQYIRTVFNKAGICWQTGELGKVDAGGGGTIAYILAERGAEVVDCGVPMLSMHAPIELVSKADVYMTKLAYHAFLNAE